MSFDKWNEKISNDLQETLNKFLPDNHFKEVIEYSVLPAGKLFRPILVYSLAKDLGEINNDQAILAQAIELHHTYTLIHDDLPAMDDDETRRGRPSSHIKFNEWKAILAGDSLLSLSFEILAQIKPEKLPQVLRLFGEFVGAKGLIMGQVMDLGNENKSLESLLKLHELKTGRLIQLSLMGSMILSDNQDELEFIEKVGYSLGINFQLLDDLCELTEPVNDHEKEINPFLHYGKEELLSIVKENNKYLRHELAEKNFSNLSNYIQLYLDKTKGILLGGLSQINTHFDLSAELIEEIC